MAIKYAPLPSSTLLISIIGFFISVIYFMDKWPSFGFSFMIVFVIMFIASFISMTNAKDEDLILMEEFEQKRKGGALKESKEEKELEDFLHISPKKKKKKR